VPTSSKLASSSPAHAGRSGNSSYGGPASKYARAWRGVGEPSIETAVNLSRAVGGEVTQDISADTDTLTTQRRFPTDFGDVMPQAVYVQGHDGPVACVLWCCDGIHFVSIGQNDNQMHVWHLDSKGGGVTRALMLSEGGSPVVGASECAAVVAPRAKFRAPEVAIRRCMDWGEWLPAGILPGVEAALLDVRATPIADQRPTSKASSRPPSARLDGPSRVHTLAPLDDENFVSAARSAPRPWVRDAVDPTAVVRPQPDPPEASLRLAWCGGYAGRTGLR